VTRIWLIQAKGSLYQERAIVFEFGSGVSAKSSVLDDNDPLIAKSRACKRDGNEQFKAEGFSKAYNMYVKAIEACCGMTGEELLNSTPSSMSSIKNLPANATENSVAG
jgi:hypothetical protein